MRQVEIDGKGPGGVALVALLALFTAWGENSPSDVEDQPGTAVVTGVVAASDVQGATNVFVH